MQDNYLPVGFNRKENKMKTIKKLRVYHRKIVDGGREKLEQYLKKEYHAARVTIANGTAHIEWFAGANGDYKDVNVFLALFKSVFSFKRRMPENWEEVAGHWIMCGITIQQVEELMHCDIIYIPSEFFEYADKLDREYEEWCQEQMTSSYYCDQL